MRLSLVRLLLAAALCLAGCDPKRLPVFREVVKEQDAVSERETDEAIQRVPVIKELYHRCLSTVPLPDDFVLVTESVGYKKEPAYLSYKYRSGAGHERIKAYYMSHFTRNGWHLTDRYEGGWGTKHLTFRNDSYKAKIYYGGMGEEVNCAILCQKLEVSDEAK